MVCDCLASVELLTLKCRSSFNVQSQETAKRHQHQKKSNAHVLWEGGGSPLRPGDKQHDRDESRLALKRAAAQLNHSNPLWSVVSRCSVTSLQVCLVYSAVSIVDTNIDR